MPAFITFAVTAIIFLFLVIGKSPMPTMPFTMVVFVVGSTCIMNSVINPFEVQLHHCLCHCVKTLGM